MAVTVAGVLAVTLVVGIWNTTEGLPAATVSAAGAWTAGELLLKVMEAPLAGATPLSMAIAWTEIPPLNVVGEMESDLMDGGNTVSCAEAEPELSEAAMVTGVSLVTWPAVIWNCIHAVLAGMVTVAGTGAALGSELVKLITAPLDGAAVLSWICTKVELPLYKGLLVKASETGAAGAWLTVKLPLADHLVTAAVVGDASP